MSVIIENKEKLQKFYDAKDSDTIPDIEKLKKENRLFIALIKKPYTERFFVFENNYDVVTLKNKSHKMLSLCYLDGKENAKFIRKSAAQN